MQWKTVMNNVDFLSQPITIKKQMRHLIIVCHNSRSQQATQQPGACTPTHRFFGIYPVAGAAEAGYNRFRIVIEIMKRMPELEMITAKRFCRFTRSFDKREVRKYRYCKRQFKHRDSQFLQFAFDSAAFSRDTHIRCVSISIKPGEDVEHHPARAGSNEVGNGEEDGEGANAF